MFFFATFASLREKPSLVLFVAFVVKVFLCGRRARFFAVKEN
jgi:hypothetical protein